ncbi:MAG TPA: hypothetical protein VNA69_00095 [Thermoanaerobaculia bacterium]|nr:hypothetical protein [Thermoanaerobaculia bacterium]
MRKANAILFIVFALAFTVFAGHHEEKAMKPDAMLRQLDYFAGNWQCSGIAWATPMAPEHATRGDVVMKTDRELVHLAEIMPKGGEWMKLGQETCTRK